VRTLFWILWSIGALVVLVTVVFFFWVLTDGSVQSFNMGLWLGLLAVVFGVTGGSLLRKNA